MKPTYRSRYPLILPQAQDMTPRWQRIVEMVASHPEDFKVVVKNGFRIVHRIPNPKLNEQVKAMLTAMGVKPGGIKDILDIDPIESIPPALYSMWTGRGLKVAKCGLITLQFYGTDKIYQYPFVEV